MTPLERAEKALTGRLIEATNAEVEKRRAVEVENARLQGIVNSLSEETGCACG